MAVNCPKCGHKIDTNLNYKCPKCGEKFWTSKEKFEKYINNPDNKKVITSTLDDTKEEPKIVPVANRKNNAWGYVIAIGITALLTWIIASDSSTNASSTSNTDYAIVDSECSHCNSELEKAKNRINLIEECRDELKNTLNEINNDAEDNAWSDYNSMGDALDDIEYISAAFNICD